MYFIYETGLTTETPQELQKDAQNIKQYYTKQTSKELPVIMTEGSDVPGRYIII